jgi:hypothetical protein
MLHGIFRKSLIQTNDCGVAHVGTLGGKDRPASPRNPELEHYAMPELRPPETTELLCAIIAALIPLLIWAFRDLERRRYDWRYRTKS